MKRYHLPLAMAIAAAAGLPGCEASSARYQRVAYSPSWTVSYVQAGAHLAPQAAAATYDPGFLNQPLSSPMPRLTLEPGGTEGLSFGFPTSALAFPGVYEYSTLATVDPVGDITGFYLDDPYPVEPAPIIATITPPLSAPALGDIVPPPSEPVPLVQHQLQSEHPPVLYSEAHAVAPEPIYVPQTLIIESAPQIIVETQYVPYYVSPYDPYYPSYYSSWLLDPFYCDPIFIRPNRPKRHSGPTIVRGPVLHPPITSERPGRRPRVQPAPSMPTPYPGQTPVAILPTPPQHKVEGPSIVPTPGGAPQPRPNALNYGAIRRSPSQAPAAAPRPAVLTNAPVVNPVPVTGTAPPPNPRPPLAGASPRDLTPPRTGRPTMPPAPAVAPLVTTPATPVTPIQPVVRNTPVSRVPATIAPRAISASEPVVVSRTPSNAPVKLPVLRSTPTTTQRDPAPRVETPAPTVRAAAPAPARRVETPAPTVRAAAPAPARRVETPAPTVRAAAPAPARRVETPAPTVRAAAPAPAPRVETPAPTVRAAAPAPAPRVETPAPTVRAATPAPAPRVETPAPRRGNTPAKLPVLRRNDD